MLDALVGLATFETLVNVLWATLGGMVIGALPGLTATMGLALMTSLTYGMGGDQAILVLICLYVGTIYGGSRSAILLNIPGTPANAATAVEGYPMAVSGRASRALGLATIASLAGSLFGALCLYLIAPMLAEVALRFGSFEYFLLGIFGILIAGTMTSVEDPLKGWISGFFGLLVAMVGLEAMHAYERFSFGSLELSGGIALIPAMVGAFGVAELLVSMGRGKARTATTMADRTSVLSCVGDLWRSRVTAGRSSIIGTAIGIIPGVGEDVAAWISYAAGRRYSRRSAEYGTGSTDGLIAAETANSAALPGAIIPALTLAVPGSAPAAVLLAAMFIHNVRPGPMIMIENPGFVANVVWILVFASVAMAVLGLLLTRPLVAVLKIPKEYLTPVIFSLCLIGPYALSQRLFDVYVMMAFGILGFLMRMMRYPMAPLILGIILGGMIDQNLRRGLVLFERDPTAILGRPISLALIALCLLTILAAIPAARRLGGRVLGRRGVAGGVSG
ncbi:MAG: tripartite tricarboxylate transporter permease [Bauldia litoralis]|uniref:tripartite tricarboxylate transporter permease n=2 Tax=Bauldia litoralis TaxID=665467 RepID=UPI003298546A